MTHGGSPEGSSKSLVERKERILGQGRRQVAWQLWGVALREEEAPQRRDSLLGT